MCLFLLIKQSNRTACHKETYKVGKQCRRNGIPGFFDSGSSKIDADGIKGGFCGTQHHGGGSSDERVRTVFRHQVCADGQGGAAADGTSGGVGIGKGVEA